MLQRSNQQVGRIQIYTEHWYQNAVDFHVSETKLLLIFIVALQKISKSGIGLYDRAFFLFLYIYNVTYFISFHFSTVCNSIQCLNDEPLYTAEVCINKFEKFFLCTDSPESSFQRKCVPQNQYRDSGSSFLSMVQLMVWELVTVAKKMYTLVNSFITDTMIDTLIHGSTNTNCFAFRTFVNI